MDDKAYCVNPKSCGKCQYYSRESSHGGLAMCNYYLITGKHRDEQTPVSKCRQRINGPQLRLPPDPEYATGKGVAVCLK